jgi:uncharacterized OB-fold protein
MFVPLVVALAATAALVIGVLASVQRRRARGTTPADLGEHLARGRAKQLATGVFCNKCGRQDHEGGRYCVRCGAALDLTVTRRQFTGR